MKIASFRNHLGETHIGVCVNGGIIADLTAALEKYLVEESGTDHSCAIDAALERINTSMFNLINREEEGQADLNFIEKYIEKIVKPGKTLFSPSGGKITYGLEEIKLLKPIPENKGRVFNLEYTYPAYKKVFNATPPDKGKAAMFMMEAETLIGPGEDIKWPKSTNEVSSSAELGVIIGKKGKRIPASKALDYVFGYTVVNDLTGIGLLRGIGPDRICMPWGFYYTRSMIMDTFQPVGPFIVLKDEIQDPQNLEAQLKVNGKLVSKGNTKDMLVSVAGLIEFLSMDITLEPGDIISTGAIGTMEYPPEAIVNINDNIEAKIDKIGTLSNNVVCS